MMVIDAILIFMAATAVLTIPVRVLSPYPVASDVLTFVQLFAVALIAFSIHQATTSRYAGDPAFRRTTLLTVVIKLVFAFALVRLEDVFHDAQFALAVQSGLFAFLYLVTLPIKSIGYKEDK